MNNKKTIMKNFFDEKRRSIYLLSFLLPFILMVAIIIAKHVYPFGDKCILRTDFYHQYYPFYVLLQDKLKGLKSLFYTYEIGLGTNFITLMAYYLVCPFNILLFFISKNIVLEFMTFLIIFKIALSGFTFSYYLVNKYKTDSFVVIFFALFYAMGGYMSAYYWNIMWLDNIVLFPLLMHYFEGMYNGKKMYPYILVLGLSLLCNYYIGILTCIFLVFYFIFYSILREQKIKQILKNLLKTAICSLIGVLISFVFLLPILLAFKTTASSDIQFPSSAREYFSIVETIGRMMPFVKIENGIEYWPNIYSGTFVFPLFTMFLLSKKNKTKEKICYSVLILLFLASFSVNYLDFLFHAFKFPNSLPSRHSFIFTFLILSICIKPLLKMNSIKEKDIIKSFSIPIIFVILIGKNVVNSKIGFYSVYTTIIFIFIYMVLMLLYKNKKYNKDILLYVAIVVISFEAFINMYETSISTIKKEDYTKYTTNMTKLLNDLKSTTDDFYRVEREDMKTKNDGAYIGFPSASIFSSSAYASGTDFYKKIGMEASTNSYSMTGSTPFVNSILSEKYLLTERKLDKAKELNMREIVSDGDIHLYQNLYTLPFSYVLKDEWIKDYDMSSANPATVQNNVSRILGTNLMLSKVDLQIDKKEAKYTAEQDGDYYAFIRDKGIKNVTVIFPNTTKTFNNLDRGYFIELGYIKEGDTIEFRNDTNNSDLLMELFRFDYNSLKSVIDMINRNYVFDMLFYNETYIHYNINSVIDGSCIVTLPYDSGFTVKVDGDVVEKKSVFDFFLAFDITSGKHDVVITYRPVGFYEGVLVSLIATLILVLVALYENKIFVFKQKKEDGF